MNRQSIIFLLLLGFCSPVFGLTETILDSVGVQKVDGVVLIVHEVEAGETLYALSRRYNVSVDLIRQANKNDVSSLSVGQRVLIPSLDLNKNSGDIIHTVKSSETLFSISRTYNVSVDQLKTWNHMDGNSLSVGQQLIIKEQEAVETPDEVSVATGQKTHTVQQSETLYSISKMYSSSTEELIQLNNLSSSTLSVGQVLVVPGSTELDVEANKNNSSMLPTTAEETESVSENMKMEEVAVVGIATRQESSTVQGEEFAFEEKPAEKIVQKGIAEVNEQRAETKKYLGLHRDAPIGTIMQVRNEMNNQSVFVRIVGTIPDTGDNAKVILKISQKAYDRLGAVDSRFPVEVSYMP